MISCCSETTPDGEIRRGIDEVVYFTGSDFDPIVHDPLEDPLLEDGKPRMVVLDDWMNRILEDPGYVDVFTKLVHHCCLMLFPPQRQAVALRSNRSGFFLFKVSTELASV